MEKKLCTILILILIVTSCKMNTEKITKSLKADIDQLEEKYAPDSRIVAWYSSIESKNDTIRLYTGVEDPKAMEELSGLMKEKYPEILTEIELLPENEPERLVHAIVSNSVASIRSEPKHKAEMVNQAFLGTPVRVLKKKSGWYWVQTPNRYLGWINGDDIAFYTTEELNKHKQLKKVVYNRQFGHSYAEPNINSQVVSDLVIGCILPVTGQQAGFTRLTYPDGRTAWVKSNELIDMMTVFNRVPDGLNLVNTAKKFNGIPYMWGGFSSKAIDCSGFTSGVYFLNGVVIMRDASQQIRYGEKITEKYEFQGLLPGDLLFFGRRAKDTIPERVTHVAMYIGDTEFIHASGKVKINSIDSTRTNSLPNYEKLFIRTMRYIGHEGSEAIEKITENAFYKHIIPDQK
jgi:gamma-D-glutamyl-L-lysine dipeptidyl-peptidase